MLNDGFTISSDPSKLQKERIHAFLSTQAYWCLGLPRSVLARAIEGSICFGVYNREDLQVGFARVVTDRATFAWLCDVYIEDAYRGKGLAHRLMEAVMAHPELQGLRRFCLTTKDAHSIYAKYGFEPTQTPTYWMEIKNNSIYPSIHQGSLSPSKS